MLSNTIKTMKIAQVAQLSVLLHRLLYWHAAASDQLS